MWANLFESLFSLFPGHFRNTLFEHTLLKNLLSLIFGPALTLTAIFIAVALLTSASENGATVQGRINWAHAERRIGDIRAEKIDNSGEWLIVQICLLR
jgi:hypothetical protein